MDDFSLSNGRSVNLKRLTIGDTYSGFLEGSKESVSQYIRDTLSERVTKLLYPGQPLSVIELPQGELPRWLCVAEFDSFSGVFHDNPDYNSRLFVCWFMENTAMSLDHVLEGILKKVDWEGFAEDYDMMDF